MRTICSLWIIVLAAGLFGGALASDNNAQRPALLRRQNSGRNVVERVEVLPTYAKVADREAALLSVGSVEDAFHRQYQEHKERLSQPLFEGHGPSSQEQRQALHDERHKLMAIHFDGLRDSNPADRPLFLNGINHLRHPTQVYPGDPGASLRLGEAWKFERHGCYPALRLASLASHNAPSSYLAEELQNADHAILLQSNLNKGAGTYRGLAAYTDNLSLLKTARHYFASAHAQRDWRGTGIEELEQIGERTAKRLRLRAF